MYVQNVWSYYCVIENFKKLQVQKPLLRSIQLNRNKTMPPTSITIAIIQVYKYKNALRFKRWPENYTLGHKNKQLDTVIFI